MKPSLPIRLLLSTVFAGVLILAARANASPLGEALNKPSLAWTTGGDAPWFTEATTHHDGVAAAQSGVIADGQSSWVETTVTGPVAVLFWWKVSSEICCDTLSAIVDGENVINIRGEEGWARGVLNLPAGAHTVRWAFEKDGSVSSGYDAAWLDEVVIMDTAGQKPTVVTSPQSQILAEGTNATLSVTVAGEAPFTYNWQHAGTNLLEGDVSGTTRDRLYFFEISPDYAGDYQVLVSNSFGGITSAVATITVAPSAPWIDYGPSSVDIGLGSATDLYTRARGSRPLHYQWLHDGVPFADATNATHSLPVAQPGDAGNYIVVVTNNFGSVTSSVATVFVSSNPPVIYQNPSDQTVPTGIQISLSVGYSGSEIMSLQWQKDGFSLPGQTSSVLYISPTDYGDAGLYWAVISNAFGVVTSGVARVTIIGVDPLTLALNNTNLVFSPGGNGNRWFPQADVTHDGEAAAQSGFLGPDQETLLRTVVAGPGTISFSWKVTQLLPEPVPLSFSVDGTVLAEIVGETDWQQATFLIGAGPHQLEWRYSQGSIYSLSDAAWLDEVGWVVRPPELRLADALDQPTWIFQNDSLSAWFPQTNGPHDGIAAAQTGPVTENSETTLGTTLTGPGTLAFWWKISSEENAGVLQLLEDGVVIAEISDEMDWSPQSLEVGGGLHQFEWRYFENGSVSEVAGRGWLDQLDWITNTTSLALSDALDAPDIVFANDSGWPWFAQTATAHDGVDAAQSPSLPVGEASEFTTSVTGPGTLSFWAKVSAAPADVLQFRWLYSQYVDLWYGEGDWQYFSYELPPGGWNLGWRFCKRSPDLVGKNAAFVDEITFTPRIAPTITDEPQPVKILKGRPFALSVTATGNQPLTYQWLKNGISLAGATTAGFSRPSGTYEETGNYSVIVSNSAGAVTSAVARVAVVPCFYSARDLGTLTTNHGTTWLSEAEDINNAGIVVGYSLTDEGGLHGVVTHGFVWIDPDWIYPSVPAVMRDLGDGRQCLNNDPTNRMPGNSYAWSIGPGSPGVQGDIVGWYEYRTNPSMDGPGHAALWSYLNCAAPGGTPVITCGWEMYDVHPRDVYVYEPDTEAVAINSHRQILLQAGQTWVLAHAGYLLVPTYPRSRINKFDARKLPSDGAGWFDPYGMNESGLIVGRYREFIGGDMTFIYDGSGKFAANPPYGALTAVNDGGSVAGYRFQRDAQGYSVPTPFLARASGDVEWLTNSSLSSFGVKPKHINNRNQIVGDSFFYTDGFWFLLDDLVLNPNVTISTANSINDRGQIVGVARFPYTYGYHACLLTPASTSQNHVPVAANDEIRISSKAPLRIPASLLLANDTDADHEPLCVIRCGEGDTQQGGSVFIVSGGVFYTPPNGTGSEDTFSYTISDGPGGQASAQVHLIFDPVAPPATPLINPPQPQSDGTVLLSGNAPAGSVVCIYTSSDTAASYWKLDMKVTVPGSGQWSIIRPGTIGGAPAFYKAEIQIAE